MRELSDQEVPNPPLQPWLWLVGLLGVVSLLAAGWLWWQRPPSENSPEVSFARDMIAHHEQAIEMALIIRDRTDDDLLRLFATDLLLTQQGQIGRMTAWLELWGVPFADGDPAMGGMGTMMGMATQTEMNELHELDPIEAETRFYQLMIRHHQGGVLMAEEVLQQTNHPAVQRLASAMVNGQQGEIDYMLGLLAERGAEPFPAVMPMDHHNH